MKRLVAWFYPDPSQPLTQVWISAIWMGLVANWPLWKQLQALPELGGRQVVVDLLQREDPECNVPSLVGHDVPQHLLE